MGFHSYRRTRLTRALAVSLSFCLCLLGVLAPKEASGKQAPTAALAPKGHEVAPYEAYYGIYVGGQKVGWMRSSYEIKPMPTLSYRLEAQVRGMGRTSPVTVEEVRTFDPTDHRLQSVSFSQRAEAGQVQVVAKRQGDKLACTTTAGGAQHKVTVAADETLEDALALLALVSAQNGQAPKVGLERTVKHFDPQSQSMSPVHMRIDAVREILVAGVATPMFTITTTYPDMGVKEESTVDGSGQLIKTHMGGFFEAKLEPKDVAQKLDMVQDVLMQAVVKAPKPLANPEALERLTLTMTGFDDAPPPTSGRQRVERTDKGWRLILRKDAPFGAAPYPESRTKAEPPEVAEALQPTAFVQSTAPEIVAAARQAVGKSKTMAEAILGLVGFVQKHLRAEYVPAFSNALEALHTGRGDCTEFSVLFVALARAANIPARVAVGVAYWPPGAGFGWHAWAEIYSGGRWVSVDPTWAQPISDVTHLKFAEGGPQEQARVVMLLGRLKIQEMNVP